MKVTQLLRSARVEVQKPYEEKLEMTRRIIDNFLLLFRRCFVSCSFGKDSIVVLHLVRGIQPDIPVVFNNTGVDGPETYEYRDRMVEMWGLKLYETLPVKGWDFFKVADKYGLPDGRKRSDMCCDYLKEIPLRRLVKEQKWEINFTGMTVLESRNRMFTICERGQSYLSKKDICVKVHPIAYWTDGDVWRYIHENNIPVNPVYEKYGVERTGCIPCTSHRNWREQMSRVHPKLYRLICERYFSEEVP